MKLIGQKVVGIDLHDHLVQLVELRQISDDQVSLEAYNRMTIPSGVIEEGEIKDEDGFKGILQELFIKANPRPIEMKNIAILLPARTTFVHIFSFPAALSKKEVRKAIPYEAEMVIPFPMKDLYWDVAKLEKTEDPKKKGKGYQQILFAAVQKEVADKYTKILGSIGITPFLYGTHVEALKYALEKQIPPDETSLIIGVGALSTNYLTVQGGVIKHFLSSNEGTSQLMQELSEEFKTDRDDLSENWERHKSDPQYQEKISNFIKSKYRMATDIIISKQEKDAEIIQNIILTGEFSNLPNFQELAKKQFPDKKIMIGDPKSSLKIEDEKFASHIQKKGLQVPYSIYFTNPIGVALNGIKKKKEGAVNLIPAWLKRKFSSKKAEMIIVGASIAMAAISLVIAGVIVFKHQTLSYERLNLEIKKSNVEMTLYGTRYQEIKQELEDFNSEVTILSNIDNGLVSVPTALENIYDLIPEEITITALEFNDEELSIEITGIAERREELLNLQKTFDNSDFVEQVEIPLSSYDKKTEIPFQMNIYLNFSLLPEYDTESTL